jgi:hypothetical protein
VNGNPISNNSNVAVSPGEVYVIGVSFRNDGTAPSGNVVLHLQIDSPDPSFEIVNSDDIPLGTIQNDSICVNTDPAYQVNVLSSAKEWDGIVLFIAIYENWVPKIGFGFIMQVPGT